MSRYGRLSPRHLGWALIGLSVVIGITTVLPLTNPLEITRIRNSLLADMGSAEDFGWTGQNVPSDFRRELAVAPKVVRQAATAIRKRLAAEPSQFQLARALAEHLVQGPSREQGRQIAVQSTTLDAYRSITTDGKGYCADYTQVFIGVGHALDLITREWGMSFDGFGGDGHAFSEVWDEDLGQWVFIDSFNSFYVVDPATDRPLSALEFRALLGAADAEEQVTITPIRADQFGFTSNTAAIEYYKRGAEQFFLVYGADVFTYDRFPLIQLLGSVSRALEQLWGITTGIYPRLRVYPAPGTLDYFHVMQRAGRFFFLGVAATALCFFIGVFLVRRHWRRATT